MRNTGAGLLILFAGMLTACAGAPGYRTRTETAALTGGEAAGTAAAIRSAIAAQRDLGRHELRVEVTDGVATLRGEVDSEADRQAIVSAARSVSRAAEVHDLLTVRTVDDSVLRGHVLASLEREPDVELAGVDIAVHGGTVIVSGAVPNHRVIDRILANVLMVPGVKNIESRVTIAGRQPGQRQHAAL